MIALAAMPSQRAPACLVAIFLELRHEGRHEDRFIGTGVLIDARHVITCEHVLAQEGVLQLGARVLLRRAGTGSAVRAGLVAADLRRDLALLALDSAWPTTAGGDAPGEVRPALLLSQLTGLHLRGFARAGWGRLQWQAWGFTAGCDRPLLIALPQAHAFQRADARGQLVESIQVPGIGMPAGTSGGAAFVPLSCHRWALIGILQLGGVGRPTSVLISSNTVLSFIESAAGTSSPPPKPSLIQAGEVPTNSRPLWLGFCLLVALVLGAISVALFRFPFELRASKLEVVSREPIPLVQDNLDVVEIRAQVEELRWDGGVRDVGGEVQLVGDFLVIELEAGSNTDDSGCFLSLEPKQNAVRVWRVRRAGAGCEHTVVVRVERSARLVAPGLSAPLPHGARIELKMLSAQPITLVTAAGSRQARLGFFREAQGGRPWKIDNLVASAAPEFGPISLPAAWHRADMTELQGDLAIRHLSLERGALRVEGSARAWRGSLGDADDWQYRVPIPWSAPYLGAVFALLCSLSLILLSRRVRCRY